MYWLERFGTTVLTTKAPDHYVGAGQVGNAAFFPLPGGGMYDGLGSEQAATQGMLASFQGAALTVAEFQGLRALMGKREILYRRWDDGSLEWAYARLMSVDAQRMSDNLKAVLPRLQFQVLSAVWNGEQHGPAWTFDSGEYFDTGLAFDQATDDVITLSAGSGANNDFTINNGGNAPVRNPILTIHAGSVDITNVVITGGKATHLVYAGTISAGDDLVIDCGAWSVDNEGTGDYDNFSLGAQHEDDGWLTLEPGDNDLRVVLTGGGTDSTITFEFSDGWQ